MPRQNSNRQTRSNRQIVPVSTVNLPVPPGYNIVQAPTTQAMVNYYAVAQQNVSNIGQPVTLKLIRGRQRLVAAAAPIPIQPQTYAHPLSPQQQPTSPLQRAPAPSPQPPTPNSLPMSGGSVAMTTINYHHHQQQQQMPPDYNHHHLQLRTPDFAAHPLLKNLNIQNLNPQFFNEAQTSPGSPSLPPQAPPHYRQVVPSQSPSTMMPPLRSPDANYQMMAPTPSSSPNRQLSPSPLQQYAMGPPPPPPQYLHPLTPPTPPMMTFNGTRYEETQVVLSPAEQQMYFSKLQELTKYKGFLREVIIYLRSGHSPENAPKLARYEGLLRLLNNASRAMIPFQSLLRCEEILKILVKTVKYMNLGQGSSFSLDQRPHPPEALSPLSAELEKMQRVEAEAQTSQAQSSPMPTPRMAPSDGDLQDAFQQMQSAVLGAMKNPGESNAVLHRLQETVDTVSGVKDSTLPEKIQNSRLTPESQDTPSDHLTDLELSLDIPRALRAELKLVDSDIFQIKVSRNPSILELHVILRDNQLPWLPPLKLMIPQDYPDTNLIVNFSNNPDPQTSSPNSPLPEKIENLLKAKMTLLPGRFTVSELLRTWELCVSQASDPSYQESNQKWENLAKAKSQQGKNNKTGALPPKDKDNSNPAAVISSVPASTSAFDLELSDTTDGEYNFDNLALSLG